MRPSSLGPTREKSQETPHNSKGFLTSQRQDERLPQVLVAKLVNPNVLPQLEKYVKRFPLLCELRPDSPDVTPHKSREPPCNSNRNLTSLRQRERLPEFSAVPSQESQASRHNSRKTRRLPRPRDMGPFVPAVPREQSRLPSPNSR